MCGGFFVPNDSFPLRLSLSLYPMMNWCKTDKWVASTTCLWIRSIENMEMIELSLWLLVKMSYYTIKIKTIKDNSCNVSTYTCMKLCFILRWEIPDEYRCTVFAFETPIIVKYRLLVMCVSPAVKRFNRIIDSLGVKFRFNIVGV